MALLFANNASGTLSVTLTVGATSAVLQSSEGALFPTPSGGDTFYATLENVAGVIEIVSCTARSSDTFTIVRAQEGTTAIEFATGSRFEIRLTAATINAFLQSAAADALYAPLTHFNDNGVSAELLNDAVIAVKTGVQGASIRRTAGQTETQLVLQSDAGTTEVEVSSNTSKTLDVVNKQIAGQVRLRATNTAGTEVTGVASDPDGATWMTFDSALKVITQIHGATIYAENSLAPFNGHFQIRTSDGVTTLANIGYVSTTNEFRLASYVDNFIVALIGSNAAGALVNLLTGDPNGALNGFFANAKKWSTASTGFDVLGVVTQTTAPTAANHLTRKDYVDAQVAAAAPPGGSLAQNGYYTHTGGFTEQWGRKSISGNGTQFVTYPTAYAQAFSVVATVESTSPGTNENVTQISSVGTSGFYITNGADVSRTFHWQAKGAV